MLWAIGVSLGAVPIFATLPAWASTRATQTQLAKTRATDRRTRRLSGRLVAAQVALVIPLLVASSMQLRSVRALSEVETGFDVESTLVAGAALPVSQFGPAEQKSYIDRAVEKLERLPGVQSVGAMSLLPLSRRDAAIVTYRPDQEGDSGLPNVHYRVITHGLLRTLGVPMVSGREFEPRSSCHWMKSRPIRSTYPSSRIDSQRL